MSVAAPIAPLDSTLMMQKRAYFNGSNGYGGYADGASDGGDEEEDEESGRMLGFMFGNVDDTGDLDVEYLDQEAKKHLFALTDQLGSSLLDLELPSESVGTSAADEDYDRKAEDAVDYEDIDEACEDDGQMLPEEKQYYAQAAVAAPSKPVETEDNYDEEEEEQTTSVSLPAPTQPVPSPSTQPVPAPIQPAASEAVVVPAGIPVPTVQNIALQPGIAGLGSQRLEEVYDVVEWEEEYTDDEEEEPFEEFSPDDDDEVPHLPVIYQEHGKQILQFSEIFGAKQPFWVIGNKKIRSKRSKGRPGKFDTLLDGDDAEALRQLPENCDLTQLRLHEKDDRETEDLNDLLGEDSMNKNKFLPSEPLNKDLPELADLEGAFAANFDPVHQMDWEKGIIWDSREGKLDSQDEDSEDVQQTSFSGRVDRIVVLEPLTKQVKPPKTVSRHPQMLRLECSGNELVGRLDRLNLEGDGGNTELATGAWLQDVLWDNESRPRKYNVIHDLTDSHMVFEVADTKETKFIRDHAGAIVLTPRLTKSNRVAEVSELVPSRFNISNDKYYLPLRSTGEKIRCKKRLVQGGVKVVHSLPALKLQTMKPKLTNKDLANFHRPKATWFPHQNEVAAKEQGQLALRGPMKVILKTLGGKGSKIHIDASDTLETFMLKAAKKLGDLKPSEKTKVTYCGSELQSGKTFADQKIPPNSVLHLVRTKVHPLPRAQRVPGENKPTRPPSAFRKKSELSVKDGHVALMEYCEERPLLLSNVGMGAVLSTYYRKMSQNDQTAVTLKEEKGAWLGTVLPLEPSDDSPFLGNIRLGDTQSCLETNMYRAPIFQHQVSSTDFLLVRSPKGKLSLRRIDSIHVVGQQEPHIEVIAPSSKNVLAYLGNRLLVHVFREFRSKDKPGSQPQIAAEELMAHFPSLNDGFIRKRLKPYADLQRGANGEMRWVKKKGFRIPSEEEIRRMVAPEHVCGYESMQAGMHHLKRMGVHKLTQHLNVGEAISELPDEATCLAAAATIERELQLTPWNLSYNFVAATMQGRNGIDKLDITGPGDPTGRGLGFSYLRAALRPATTGPNAEKKAAAARGGGSVTGTDADLRRLSMDAAREVLLNLGVSEMEIEKLTRWQRIALVRKLSSEQAASGGLSIKFARGPRMQPQQVQHQSREKCQEIWDRQVQSLLAIDGEDAENEEEGNGEWEDFAGDLENLLEAEEEDEKNAASKNNKKDARGRRRAQQAQLEEDLEDEAAEAAELHHMLMEDDEAEEEEKRKREEEEKKINKKAANMNGVVNPPVAVPRAAPSLKTGVKKKTKYLKRTVMVNNPDGTRTPKVEIIKDPIEVAKYLERKKLQKKKDLPKPGMKPKPARKKPTPLNKNNLNGKARDSKEGPQLICGACHQPGHMRTNKKKCPLYSEENNIASTPKPEPEFKKLIVKRNDTEDSPKLRVKVKASDSMETPLEQKSVISNGRAMKIRFKLPSTQPTGQRESSEAEADGDVIVRDIEKEVEQVLDNEDSIPQAYGEEQIRVEQERPASQESQQQGTKRPRDRAEDKESRKKNKKHKHKYHHKKEKQKVEEERPEEKPRVVMMETFRPPDTAQEIVPRKIVIKRRPEQQLENSEPPKRQRKRGGGEVELANILEGVVEEMKKSDCSFLFRKPVTKKEAPDYHIFIRTPMDLSTIRDRVRRLYYKNRVDFLVDVHQIVNNAHTYNENRNPGIPPLADALLKVCETLLRERDAEISEAEERMGEEEGQAISASSKGRRRSIRSL